MKVTTYHVGRAEIRIYRPELTKDEQEKRERKVQTALQVVGKYIEETRGRYVNGNSNQTRDFNKE